MPDIRLHSKLGVNPRMVNIHCRLCGKKEGDSIVLLGSANYRQKCNACGVWSFGGFNRPKMSSYSEYMDDHNKTCPSCGSTDAGERVELQDWDQIETVGTCKECKEWMTKGIVLVSAKESPKGPILTGCFTVLTLDGFDKLPISPPELKAEIRRKRACYLPDEAWDALGLPRKSIPATVPSDTQTKETVDEAERQSGSGGEAAHAEDKRGDSLPSKPTP